MNQPVLESLDPKVEIQGRQVEPKPVPVAAGLLLRINDLGNVLREVIIETKRLPRDAGYEPHQDPTRSLALAQAHLQTGFMWLRKAVTRPKEF